MPKETLKKVINGDVPVGPDKYYGGDGLPDWMQFTISLLLFGLLYWILNLLLHPKLELDATFRATGYIYNNEEDFDTLAYAIENSIKMLK